MAEIEPFPGKLTKSKALGTPYVLNESQIHWLAEWFPVTEDRTLMKMMGCSYMSVRRLAEKHGIKKDRVAMRERFSQTMKNIIESERRRDRWGLPRNTSLMLAHKPYSSSQTAVRHRAIKQGYVLATDCSYEGGHRYVIYYDENTKRNAKFEKTYRKHGFEIKEWRE